MSFKSESRQILKIVVASPNDVKKERDQLSIVIDELNRSMGAAYGFHLEFLRWETDAYPGFHLEGPQALIDQLLKIKQCDILIGIFWKRFGTPTEDAKSGTEHEFRIAYKSWKETKRPHIMVYFKQKEYAPQTGKEIDQWKRVLDFKKSFPKEGLWWSYRSNISFERMVRLHISKYLFDLYKKREFGSNCLIVRFSEDLISWNKKIAKEARKIFVATGSRTRDKIYLQAIEETLKKFPRVIHYRVLFGPPHWSILRDHLKQLLEIRSPCDYTYGYKTIFLAIFEDTLKQPETFICANEKNALVVLPSFKGICEYNSAVVFFGSEEVGGLIRFVKELYNSGRIIESKNDINDLKLLKGALDK